MAMHPKLTEGSILLYYPEMEQTYRYRYGEPPIPLYTLTIKVLYVYNRRARTNGAYIPVRFRKYLESLKVRIGHGHGRGDSERIVAVGCQTRTVRYEESIGEPKIPAEFITFFSDIKANTNTDDRIYENEFIQKFLATRIQNKDKKGVLFTPVESIVGFHTPKEILPLESTDIWAESRY